MKDDKLWKVFSEFIRLRDSDENGYCKCITCGNIMKYDRGMHAGHFISRRHLATKFDETNVHAQCCSCNAFHSGLQYEYSLELNRRNPGTSERLLVLSRGVCQRGKFEIDELTKYYRNEVKKLKLEKGLK